MCVIPFVLPPENSIRMVRATIIEDGLFHVYAELPKNTFDSICKIAEMSRTDPAEYIMCMAKQIKKK